MPPGAQGPRGPSAAPLSPTRALLPAWPGDLGPPRPPPSASQCPAPSRAWGHRPQSGRAWAPPGPLSRNPLRPGRVGARPAETRPAGAAPAPMRCAHLLPNSAPTRPRAELQAAAGRGAQPGVWGSKGRGGSLPAKFPALLAPAQTGTARESLPEASAWPSFGGIKSPDLGPRKRGLSPITPLKFVDLGRWSLLGAFAHLHPQDPQQKRKSWQRCHCTGRKQTQVQVQALPLADSRT